MPDPLFMFTGPSPLGYPDYADTATDRMLTADPGGTYGIRAVDGIMPVPPADGRWVTAWAPPPPVPPVPELPEPEGSEA